jgi:hypothetical protein
MRNAPSVMYPVGRCAFHVKLLLVLAAVVAASLWGWRGSGVDMRLWLTTLVGALLWLVWALRTWWRSPTGHLHWDALAPGLQSTEAGAWFWLDSAGLASQPVLGVEQALDLQRVVLLRLRSTASVPRWVWVQQPSDPARWLDLRRALQRASA